MNLLLAIVCTLCAVYLMVTLKPKDRSASSSLLLSGDEG